MCIDIEDVESMSRRELVGFVERYNELELKIGKFQDLVEGRDYIDLEKRTANSNMIGHPEGVEEGDIVEYRYYPDPKMHRAIVAWNAEEERYVLQTFRQEEVNQFKADGISDYCDLDQADEIIILGSTSQFKETKDIESFEARHKELMRWNVSHDNKVETIELLPFILSACDLIEDLIKALKQN